MSYKLVSCFSSLFSAEAPRLQLFPHKDAESGAFLPLTGFDCQRVGVREFVCISACVCMRATVGVFVCTNDT